MSGVQLAMRQLRYEHRAFWRNPEAAVFTFALPIVLMIVFALINSDSTVETRGDIDFMTFLVPGILAYGIINCTYQYLAVATAQIRELGVLKRLRGTPLPPWSYLVGRSLVTIEASIVMVMVVLVLGRFAYDVEIPGATVGALLVTLAIGMACFAAMGLAITGLIPNGDAAPPIAIGIMLPLVFLSGIFFAIETAPGWLELVTKLLPIQHFANALQDVFDPATTGSGFNVGDLAVVGAWTVACGAIALKTFKWE